MATYTSNLGLKMPAQSDKIRIADINGNMDDIDSAIGAVGSKSIATQMGDIRAGLAIVAVNNTHAAIASGEYVYVTGHSTLDDGLYTASSAIAQNATLSSSNLTAVSGGGLNSLSNQIANIGVPSDVTSSLTGTNCTINNARKAVVGKVTTYYLDISTSSALNYGTEIVSGLDQVIGTYNNQMYIEACSLNDVGTVAKFVLYSKTSSGALMAGSVFPSSSTRWRFTFTYIAN